MADRLSVLTARAALLKRAFIWPFASAAPRPPADDATPVAPEPAPARRARFASLRDRLRGWMFGRASNVAGHVAGRFDRTYYPGGQP